MVRTHSHSAWLMVAGGLPADRCSFINCVNNRSCSCCIVISSDHFISRNSSSFSCRLRISNCVTSTPLEVELELAAHGRTEAVEKTGRVAGLRCYFAHLWG